MPYSFGKVNVASAQIFDAERRYVYTTPKSFLELIKLYSVMLGKQRSDLNQARDNYESGVIKLKKTGEDVAILEEELKIFAVEVEAKKKVADAQAEVIGVEKAKVEIENNKASIEAEKCAVIQAEVEAVMSVVQSELDAALPLVQKAELALQGLNLKDFQFLKALPSPPAAVEQVFFCVCQLLAGLHPDIPVDKNKKLKEQKTWKISQKLMQDPAKFISEWLNPFKDKVVNLEVVPHGFKAIRDILKDPEFEPKKIETKSKAAAGVCDWVINIVAYYDVVVTVEPKKIAVATAQEQLRQANEKKAEVDALVARLNGELAVLQADF